MNTNELISELQNVENQLNSNDYSWAKSNLNILIGELEDSLDTWDYNEASEGAPTAGWNKRPFKGPG